MSVLFSFCSCLKLNNISYCVRQDMYSRIYYNSNALHENFTERAVYLIIYYYYLSAHLSILAIDFSGTPLEFYSPFCYSLCRL